MAHNLRETLAQREGLSDDDVQQVIGRAAQRQAEASGKTSQAEVEDIARQLDIDPIYVGDSLRELRLERQAALRAKSATEARKKRLTTNLVAGAAVFLAFFFLFALSGARPIKDARNRALDTGGRLAQVIDRQARLAPQLLALSGGRAPASLAEAQRQLEAAATPEEKLAASRQLSTALAEALATLPAPSSPAEESGRQELRFELTGAENRITTEQRRYEEAKNDWRAAADSLRGSLAITLGLAPRP